MRSEIINISETRRHCAALSVIVVSGLVVERFNGNVYSVHCISYMVCSSTINGRNEHVLFLVARYVHLYIQL